MNGDNKKQQIESELKINNELISTILESFDGIIYVSDFDTYELLYVNNGLKELLGFDPTGSKCWQYIHAHQKGICPFCSNQRLLSIDGNPAQPVCWEYVNPYNKKWYAAKDQAIKWLDGRYVRLEVAVDITSQKQMQQFLQEARLQAESARDSKSRYVALVAHDLKSPFVAILGMLKRILERETFSYPVHKKFLETIITNGQSMMSMIDNLLDMDRLETGKMRPVLEFFNSSKMVDDAFKNFTLLAREKNITLKNKIPFGKQIYADRYLYFTVLNNLISNAIKFCYTDGQVSVFMPDETKSNTLAVKDTGQGVKEEMIADLFDEDVQTISPGTSGEKGTGLGLIFCKEILKAHGGIIRVESSTAKGSTFFIELPEVCDMEDADEYGSDE